MSFLTILKKKPKFCAAIDLFKRSSAAEIKIHSAPSDEPLFSHFANFRRRRGRCCWPRFYSRHCAREFSSLFLSLAFSMIILQWLAPVAQHKKNNNNKNLTRFLGVWKISSRSIYFFYCPVGFLWKFFLAIFDSSKSQFEYPINESYLEILKNKKFFLLFQSLELHDK